MKHEVSNGAILCTLITAGISALFTCFGLYALGTGLDTMEVVSHIGSLTGQDYLIMLGKLSHGAAIILNIAILGLLIALIERIESTHLKTGIFEDVGSILNMQQMQLTGDTAYGDALSKAAGTYKKYDLMQYRRYMNKVSIAEAIKCDIDTLIDNAAIIVPHTLTLRIEGKVEKAGSFYKIGNTLLSCGRVLLKPGSMVDITIEAPITYETSLNTFTVYTVISDNAQKA